jgi:DNA-binding NtrC family response regulator
MAPAISFRSASGRNPQAALDQLFEAFFAVARDRRGGPPNLSEWVDLAEAWRIVLALQEARGSRAEAARALGIGRRTLYSKMEKFGITPRFSLW